MKRASSIVTPDSDECAFCAYLDGTRPYTIVARTADVAVMVTREQRGIPHVLVVPTAHFETLLDLPDRTATALMLAVRQSARAIDTAYRRPAIAVWQNNGIQAEQTIGHVHFHVAGTKDGGGTDRGTVQELGLDATQKIADRLQPALHL